MCNCTRYTAKAGVGRQICGLILSLVEILECSSKATDGALAADAIGEKAVFNPNPANPTDIVKDLSMAIPHYASKGKDNKV